MTGVSIDPQVKDHLERVIDMLLTLEEESPDDEHGAARQKAMASVRPPLEALPSPPSDPFTTLIRRFGLSRIEADLLRIAAAAELDATVADTYQKLQNDRRWRRPNVALAFRLLEPDPHKRAEILPFLHENAPLRRHRLLDLAPPWRDAAPLLMDYELALPPDVVLHLTGVRAVTADLMPALTLVTPESGLETLTLTEAARRPLEQLARLGERAWDPGSRLGPPGASGLLVHLYGRYGTGRRSVAAALARAWELELLVVDLRRVEGDLDAGTEVVNLILRDALRLGAVPMFMHADRLMETQRGDERPVDPIRLERFMEALADFPGPVFTSGERPAVNERLWHLRRLVEVGLTMPDDEAMRLSLWKQAVDEAEHPLEDPQLLEVSQRFTFTPGQIRDAVRAAQSKAASRDPLAPQVGAEDLHDGSVVQMRSRLETLSRKTRQVFTWDDLVLPDSVKRHLRMFEGFIRNRDQVYNGWGLGRKLSSGRGIKALFFGASGTGKTMAASVIAAQLHIELFKVDLSSIVSKWVGETEKNLDRVFTEAQKSHAILLFDEADALFGKRGGVEKGSDRYSNMEINYLLQRFEEYEGVVILTSNFPRGIDDAFSRRMHFVIEFPTPDPAMRRRLWEAKLPPELPLAPDVDLERLATRFDLSGGNIQNVVLGAAFLAAEKNSPVTMLDFMRAIQWEYQKIGRSTSRGEFQEFFDELA